MNTPKNSSDNSPDQDRRTSLSNRTIGLIIAGLTLLWFVVGLTYAVIIN